MDYCERCEAEEMNSSDPGKYQHTCNRVVDHEVVDQIAELKHLAAQLKAVIYGDSWTTEVIAAADVLITQIEAL